jgi:hypothetical protein
MSTYSFHEASVTSQIVTFTDLGIDGIETVVPVANIAAIQRHDPTYSIVVWLTGGHCLRFVQADNDYTALNEPFDAVCMALKRKETHDTL